MEDRIIALLKIGKKEHQQHVYNEGQFYMSPSKYFYTMAQNNDTGLVYDLHESSFPRNVVFSFGGINLTPFDESDDSAVSLNLGMNTCIFCFYAVTDKLISSNNNTKSFMVPCQLIKGIIGNENPSEYEIVVIKKPALIVERIIEKIKSFCLPASAALIQYDDHNFDIDNRKMINNANSYALELCFHKCKKFIAQNEYRIALINDTDNAREDIVIGKLNDSEYSKYDITSVTEDMEIVIDFD